MIVDQVATPLELQLERAAFGIHDIISEDVARAFRIHASERGFDYRASSMIAFGGCGPVHAIRVARKLGIPRVVFPVAAGVMSAIGLLASPLSFEVAHTRERFVRDLDNAALAGIFAGVEAEAKAPLLAAGLDDPEIEIVRHLDMRYHGQGHEIEVTLASTHTDVEALAFAPLDAPLVITTWKVEARGPQPGLDAGYSVSGESARETCGEKGTRRAYFPDAGGWVETPVYDRYSLTPGSEIRGVRSGDRHSSRNASPRWWSAPAIG